MIMEKFRNDKKGKNTLEVLKPYSNYSKYLSKGYLNCNIQEKIAIRVSFCGLEYPSVCIMDWIK